MSQPSINRAKPRKRHVLLRTEHSSSGDGSVDRQSSGCLKLGVFTQRLAPLVAGWRVVLSGVLRRRGSGSQQSEEQLNLFDLAALRNGDGHLVEVCTKIKGFFFFSGVGHSGGGGRWTGLWWGVGVGVGVGAHSKLRFLGLHVELRTKSDRLLIIILTRRKICSFRYETPGGLAA